MRNGVFKYLALWFFLAGVVLIVFIQFISGKNNERLVQGNKRLLKEVKIQNELRRLEADVLTVESDIRGAIITNDPAFLININDKINNIQKGSAALTIGLKDSLNTADITLLNTLIQNKLFITQQILNAYSRSGKDAGELIINTGRSKGVTDSIIAVVNKMDSSRQSALVQIIGSIESTGAKARMGSLVLAGVACIACVLAFLYVINRGRQQQRVISMLNKSEKKIKEAAKIKEEFLANMSHEIRTPMNAILGFTTLLKKTDLDTHQLQYVEYIYSSGENLLTLINDILDLSKIEAGMMNIEEAPFSLNGLISSVEVMFKEKALSKGITFKIFLDPAIHDILSGDAVRLTQILINLLGNAIKFTEKGGVQLSVNSVKRQADEIELQFKVQDTGVGIAADKKQKIFNRFQQAEAQTTRRFGGTGLGLSIVKQLVAIQNGTIELNSEEGKGSEFVVKLPFKLVHNPIELHPISVNEIISGLKNTKILVAEDNIMNQQLIRHLMRHWQLNYQIVNNGQEAVELLKHTTFSVVLMDIQMPEMDGYTATLAIRNELKLDVPIIAMTAHAMPGEKERCLSYGMNDYISKPVRDVELYAILKQHSGAEANEVVHSGIINLAYLKEISMGDKEFEQTIIQQFIIQVPEELKGLEAAIKAEDWVQMKGLAHGMKSSVSYLGLNNRLHPVLHRIETGPVNAGVAPLLIEDFEEVRSVCLQAVEESKQLITSLV